MASTNNSDFLHLDLRNQNALDLNNVAVKTEQEVIDIEEIQEMNGDEGTHAIIFSDYDHLENEDDSGGSRLDGLEEHLYQSGQAKERKRTRNFSHSEIQLFFSLLEEYLDIFDRKAVDCRTNSLKAKAWMDLSRRFNSITSEEYRTAIQLKTFYENFKKKKKRALNLKAGEALDAKRLFSTQPPPAPAAATTATDQINRQQPLYGELMMKSKMLIEEQEQKRLELINLQIEKVKEEREQQNKIFLLQEEKLKLEIEEIRQRLKKD